MAFRVPAPVLIIAIALVTAILIGLGVWQLQRNEWKNDLVAERNARITSAPLAATDAVTLPLDDIDYRRVSASGQWDHSHTMILANQARFATKGEDVVTPLLLSPEGPALLVNRGWYPEGQRDEVLARIASEPGTNVTGLARYVPEVEGWQTDAGTWNRFDAEAMAEELPYEVLPWLLFEGELAGSEASGAFSIPVREYHPYINTSPHLEYAATWFGIAAALIAIAVIRFIVTPRRERAQRASDEAPPREPEEASLHGR